MLTTKEYLELDLKKNKTEEEKQLLIEYNKNLIDRFPFLTPRNVWTGEIVNNFDYTWSELDCMPIGWRIAFGEQLCEEIKQELLKVQEKDPGGGYPESYYTTNYDSDKIIPYLEGYRITEIKEKWGELRWYDNGAPTSVHNVISKYEKLSRFVCIDCGKEAKYLSNGWISPFCEECAINMFNRNKEFLNIDDDSFDKEFMIIKSKQFTKSDLCVIILYIKQEEEDQMINDLYYNLLEEAEGNKDLLMEWIEGLKDMLEKDENEYEYIFDEESGCNKVVIK